MGFNTRILGVHLRGLLALPDHRADLLHTGANVRSPEHRAQHSGSVQYSTCLMILLMMICKEDWILIVSSAD